jgi:hypothetical protein
VILFMSRHYHWQPAEAENMAAEDLLAYFDTALQRLKSERSKS